MSLRSPLRVYFLGFTAVNIQFHQWKSLTAFIPHRTDGSPPPNILPGGADTDEQSSLWETEM